LVCGDDREAKAAVLDLAAAIGLTAYDAGPLANAGVVEGFSALLIGLNRRYKSTAAGLRITNLPRPTT
jgi:predicted dinucleotide-binding enzyme